MDKLAESIKKHEGFRDVVYKDSLGNLTCGWGHLLAEGSKVSLAIAEIFLAQDIATAVNDFMKLPNNYRRKLDEARRRVIVELIFNMGLSRLLGFKKFWVAVELEDWVEAKVQLLDSHWAAQVKGRAEELAEQFFLGGNGTNL